MPDPNTPSKEDDAPTGAFARVTRSRRASDFLVLGVAGLIVIGGMALLGEITVWAAAFAVMIMAAFSIAYFAGTAEMSGEAGRGREAADEEESRRRQAERAAPSFDALVSQLLEETE